jgi:hypothetical protein
MKALIGLILVLGFIELHAAEIRVKKMSKDGDLDRSFVLKTNLTDKVVIDCQSFIQGLRVGEYDQAHVYMLDEQDCDGLSSRIRASVQKKREHCIDVEDDIRADYVCN